MGTLRAVLHHGQAALGNPMRAACGAEASPYFLIGAVPSRASRLRGMQGSRRRGRWRRLVVARSGALGALCIISRLSKEGLTNYVLPLGFAGANAGEVNLFRCGLHPQRNPNPPLI